MKARQGISDAGKPQSYGSVTLIFTWKEMTKRPLRARTRFGSKLSESLRPRAPGGGLTVAR